MKSLNRHRNFEKQFHKLPSEVKRKFRGRLEIFIKDKSNPILKLHPLKGERMGQWSMNITGDYRAIYFEEGNTITFLEIGTHSELYQ